MADSETRLVPVISMVLTAKIGEKAITNTTTTSSDKEAASAIRTRLANATFGRIFVTFGLCCFGALTDRAVDGRGSATTVSFGFGFEVPVLAGGRFKPLSPLELLAAVEPFDRRHRNPW